MPDHTNTFILNVISFEMGILNRINYIKIGDNQIIQFFALFIS